MNLQRRRIVAFALTASLLVAVPAFAGSEVSDPLMAKLEAIITAVKGVSADTQATAKRVESLEKKVDDLHKSLTGDAENKPEVVVIKNNGSTPINTVETDDGTILELLELKEEKADLTARVRITTSPKAYTLYYGVELETGRQRVESKFSERIPPATTREAVITFKGAAGQITPKAYFSFERGSFEFGRLPLVPQK